MQDRTELSFDELEHEVADLLPPREEMGFVWAAWNKQVAVATNYNLNVGGVQGVVIQVAHASNSIG